MDRSAPCGGPNPCCAPAIGTASIHVTGCPPAPPPAYVVTAVTDFYAGDCNQPVTPPFDALLLDNDVSNSSEPNLRVTAVGVPSPGGSLTTFTGAGYFVYQPPRGFSGGSSRGHVGCWHWSCHAPFLAALALRSSAHMHRAGAAAHA